jgi:hypothetical protein
VGDTEVARLACTALAKQGNEVVHLAQPTGEDLTETLEAEVAAVAVLVRGDVTALRYALLVEHLRPRVRLVVTLFDRTVGNELIRVVPNCLVTSPADVSVPSILGACLGDDLLAVEAVGQTVTALSGPADDPINEPWRGPDGRVRSALRLLRGQLRPAEDSGRTLLLGFGLLVAALAVDWLLSVTFLDESGLVALYVAARVVATVGPAESDLHAPDWYLAVSSALMLLTIASTAIFTAGLVNRLLSPRLTSIVGRRVLPREGHVVVIGLGQVGVRLCAQLRAAGIPVVGVERDEDAAGVRRAKSLGIPVVVGDGSDRQLLERLSLGRARAMAAMGSEDLDNVEVAIASLAVAPGLRLVIRAGDDEVISETQSLFPIGQVRHVSALTAAAVASAIGGISPLHVYQDGHRLMVAHDGGVRSCEPLVRCACSGDRSR